jgi:hypothetical protein
MNSLKSTVSPGLAVSIPALVIPFQACKLCLQLGTRYLQPMASGIRANSGSVLAERDPCQPIDDIIVSQCRKPGLCPMRMNICRISWSFLPGELKAAW